MSRIIFQTKLAGESKDYSFPFDSLLASGETIQNSGAVVSVTLYAGTDGNPSVMLNGNPVYTSTGVTQSITGGTAGNIYIIACTAVTSLGRSLLLGGFLCMSQGSV